MNPDKTISNKQLCLIQNTLLFMKSLHIHSIFYLMALVLFSCSDDNSTIPAVNNSLELSLLSYTFDDKEPASIDVTVASETTWSFEVDQSWLIVTKTDENTVHISADENPEMQMRNGNIIFKNEAGTTNKIVLDQLGRAFKGKLIELPEFMTKEVRMSRNGRYLAGMTVKDGKEVPLFINTETDEKNYLIDIDRKLSPSAVRAICNDGTLALNSSAVIGFLWKDGISEELKVPEGGRAPVVEAFSADGSIMVGYCKLKSENGLLQYYPVKWINGEPEILQRPTNSAKGDPLRSGVMIRGCSDDGSVCYGSEWGDLGVVYWKGNEMRFVGGEFFAPEKGWVIAMTSNLTNISPNGRYIAANVDGYSYPTKINTETGAVDILDTYGGIYLNTVDDDGNYFGYQYTMTFDGMVFANDSNEPTAFDDWATHNLNMLLGANRSIQCISSDRKVYLGYKGLNSINGPQTIPFYIVLDE